MSKLPVAICLSLSVLAGGMAGFALLQTGSDAGSMSSAISGDSSPDETAHELKKLASALREEAEERARQRQPTASGDECGATSMGRCHGR